MAIPRALASAWHCPSASASAIIVALLLTLSPLQHVRGAIVTQATPAPVDRLMEVMVDGVPPDMTVTFGIVRTTFEAGGSLETTTSDGPSVHFVEEGAFTVTITQGTGVPQVLRAGNAGPSSTPRVGEPAGDITIKAGDAVVLPPHATAMMVNAAPTPSSILAVFGSPDAAIVSESGLSHEVLVTTERPAPHPPVRLTLDRVTVAPGGSLPRVDAPAHVTYAAVDRVDAFLLSGAGFNRGEAPIDAYVLTMSSA